MATVCVCVRLCAQTSTFTQAKENISHLLTAALHEYSSQCSVIAHTHRHTHTMKLIDYFTKNQLGASYVRALRAAEGANSKRKGG